MFNFLKNISGAIIIGISIIIGLNFQEFKDFSQTTFNSILYVVSGQKAEEERLRLAKDNKIKLKYEKEQKLLKKKKADQYKKLVNEILLKKKNLLSDQEMNNLIKIKIPKKCLFSYSDKIVEIKNTSEQIINHVTILTVIRGKVDKKDYELYERKYDFEYGLLPKENIKISCDQATNLKLYKHVPNDKLIIDRGYNLIVKPLKVNSFYHSEIKTTEIKKYLNCSLYYDLITYYNFTKNQEVENLC